MKNKGFKVYTINGITGLLLLIFATSTALLILFVLPIYIIKELWNYIIGDYFGGPVIWYMHSCLLWTATILIGYTILKKYISFAFQSVEIEEDSETEFFLNEVSKKENISKEEEEKLDKILNKTKK